CVGGLVIAHHFHRRWLIEVILREELAKHVFRRGVEGKLRKMRARPEADAVAEKQHRYARDAILDATREYVHVRGGAVHVMMRLQATQRRDLIAQACRAFVILASARGIHPRRKLVEYCIAASFQEHHGMPYILGILFRIDEIDARRAATPDLVKQAGARTVAEIAVLAGAHLEQ